MYMNYCGQHSMNTIEGGQVDIYREPRMDRQTDRHMGRQPGMTTTIPFGGSLKIRSLNSCFFNHSKDVLYHNLQIFVLHQLIYPTNVYFQQSRFDHCKYQGHIYVHEMFYAIKYIFPLCYKVFKYNCLCQQQVLTSCLCTLRLSEDKSTCFMCWEYLITLARVTTGHKR